MASKEPWRTIKNGSVEVVIYEEASGYRVVWYFAGKRERKFFVKSDAALSFAKKQSVSLGKAMPKNEAQIDAELRHFRELQERLGDTPLHVAVDFFLLNNRRQQLAPAKAETLLDEWKAQLKEDELSPGYIAAVTSYLGPYVEENPGPIHLHSSTDINRWSRARTDSEHSRWHFAAYLKTFFNWARDAKKALPMGSTEADLVVAQKPKPTVIEIYTPEEGRILLTYAADKHERGLIALGGFAGIRNSEITGERTSHGPLLASDIHFKDNAVRVTQKAQQHSIDRYAPLLPNAAAWLAEFRGTTGPIIKCGMASVVIQAIIARARAKGEEITFKRNGLRRSYISYRTAITRDVPRVADECNTSAQKIRSNYRKPGLEKPAHDWFEIMPSILPALSCPLPSIDGATSEAPTVES